MAFDAYTDLRERLEKELASCRYFTGLYARQNRYADAFAEKKSGECVESVLEGHKAACRKAYGTDATQLVKSDLEREGV